MIRKKNILGLLYACIFGTIVSCTGVNKNIGVIDLPTVYSSFDYQKEMMVEYDAEKKLIESKKDSLDAAMGVLEFNLKSSDQYTDAEKSILFENAYVRYLEDTKKADQRIDSVAAVYTEMIWNQLNTYIQQYGEHENYDILIGMQGDGNVMYVSEGSNVTEEVVEFVNKKYNGD